MHTFDIINDGKAVSTHFSKVFNIQEKKATFFNTYYKFHVFSNSSGLLGKNFEFLGIENDYNHYYNIDANIEIDNRFVDNNWFT